MTPLETPSLVSPFPLSFFPSPPFLSSLAFSLLEKGSDRFHLVKMSP